MDQYRRYPPPPPPPVNQFQNPQSFTQPFNALPQQYNQYSNTNNHFNQPFNNTIAIPRFDSNQLNQMPNNFCPKNLNRYPPPPLPLPGMHHQLPKEYSSQNESQANLKPSGNRDIRSNNKYDRYKDQKGYQYNRQSDRYSHRNDYKYEKSHRNRVRNNRTRSRSRSPNKQNYRCDKNNDPTHSRYEKPRYKTQRGEHKRKNRYSSESEHSSKSPENDRKNKDECESSSVQTTLIPMYYSKDENVIIKNIFYDLTSFVQALRLDNFKVLGFR